jgi:hypothetical protein
MQGKITFSLLARTLDKILYTTLQRLIGLKSVTDIGFLVLGIRAIIVAFIEASSLQDSKKNT